MRDENWVDLSGLIGSVTGYCPGIAVIYRTNNRENVRKISMHLRKEE